MAPSTPIADGSPSPGPGTAVPVRSLPDTLALSAPRRLASSANAARVLILIVAAACVFRCYGLDYGGFSEDEAAKAAAIRAYEQGDFTANAEHPMLMKAAMWDSVACARAWNRAADGAGWPRISVEAALRLPNALAGVATVAVLFLLARSFFGRATALWAALLLALDVTVTGLNRIGKEDSFLVLFLLLGAWLYEEARVRHLRDDAPPHGWYVASGAAFGLMLASKYLLYYLGIWALFGVAASAEARRDAGPGGVRGWSEPRAPLWFYVAIVGGFIVGNPVVLLPEIWRYVLGYIRGRTITHHGLSFAGRLYLNQPGATPWGMPWHFYLVYLATKTPLPVLGAMTLGLVQLVRRRRQRGAVFGRVFLLFFLLPASLAASKFGRYMLPTLVVFDLVAALGLAWAFDLVARVRRPVVRRLAATGLTVAVVGAPLVEQIRWSPYQSLYQNSFGSALAEPGLISPNDELYDIGVREAVAWIAQRAAPGASIASDAPGVVEEYLGRYGRSDIEARYLSMAGVAPPPVESWLLAQDSHACFESIQVVEQVRNRQRPGFVHRVRGTTAVAAYRLPW